MENSFAIICHPETGDCEDFQKARDLAEMLWDLADITLISRIYIPPPIPLKNRILDNISYLGFEESEDFWAPDFGKIFTKEVGKEKWAVGFSYGQVERRTYVDCAGILKRARAKFIFLVFPRNQKVAWNQKMSTEFLLKNSSKEPDLELYSEILRGMERLFEDNENGETEAVFVVGVE